MKCWMVSVGGRRFEASGASLTRRPAPAPGEVVRGGAYRSGPNAERLECTIDDRSILPLLTGAMLGPNEDFEKIVAESPSGRRLTTSLVSYVESGGSIKLSLLVN